MGPMAGDRTGMDRKTVYNTQYTRDKEIYLGFSTFILVLGTWFQVGVAVWVCCHYYLRMYII